VAIDAERLIGSLLRGALAGAKTEAPKPVLAVAAPTAAIPATAPAPEVPVHVLPVREAPPSESPPAREPDRHDRSGHGDRRPRSFGERERPSRERGRHEREGRSPDRAAPRLDRPAPVPAAAAGKPTRSDDGREFWEVWSEEVGRTPDATPDTKLESKHEAAPMPPALAVEPAAVHIASGQVRLYVNLGRKDGASAELVAQILSSGGAVVPVSDVELMNTHCYVNVAKETADALCAGVQGRTHNGRAVICEPARPPKRRY
jgi:hypothetical protein